MEMKRENGITLVALVITIIVLLILAGVSLSLVAGDNGILQKATNASEKHREASVEEELAMAWASCEADYWTALAGNANLSKKDFFEGNNGNKGLLGYLENPEMVESFTYSDSNRSIVTLKTDDGTNKVIGIKPDGTIQEIDLIEFTIDGKTYYAEEGMNWIEWANSSYNTDFYFADSFHGFAYTSKQGHVFLVKASTVTWRSAWAEYDAEGVGHVYEIGYTASSIADIVKANPSSCEKIIEGHAYTCTEVNFGNPYELPFIPA